MNPKPSNNFLRRVLQRLLERLDRAEKRPPRSQKLSWLEMEYHIPPWVIGVLSVVGLFGVLSWKEDFNFYQYWAVGLFAILSIALFGFYLVRDHPDIAKSDEATALTAVLFFLSLLWIYLVQFLAEHFRMINLYGTPIGFGPLLVALLLNVRLAVIMSFVIALFFGILSGYSLEITLLALVGNVTMVAVGHKARHTRHVFRAGLITGFVQVLIVLYLAVIRDWSQQYTWISMLCAFMSGPIASFFSLGTLPILEGFFSRISSLRLLELSDVNHSLLRKMSIEAPGTYHHSMIVATLAYEAASSVGANALLCRVGAYFHDIGKMVKSEYFVENQGTYGNPHDKVSPSLSRLIITSHVKEGIALGKSYKLEKQILDFIPQHHGTSQIEFFYQKALKLEETEEEFDKEEVREDAFRYAGPKPQTKEAAIVMLADSVEAASRTLEDPNHQRYEDMVYKIINKKLFDNQLNETPLTLKDLYKIANSFTNTLIALHHNRIPYPENNKTSPERKKDRLKPQK